METYLSVVVPTFNRIRMLEQVIEALNGQEDAPPFEVIIINDGSTDDTAAIMEKESGKDHAYPLNFVTQPNSGPGKARNRGVEMASGRYVIFIGDDTVPESRFLGEHARVHREHGDNPLVACLGYTGWPRDEKVSSFMDYINDYGLQFGYRLIEHGKKVPFNFFYTSNISIDRELLAANPFDTSFPSAAWEDIELAYRLDRQGLEIHYNAGAVTRHHHPMTVESFARRQYTVGKSGAIFFSKHPELLHFLGVEELRTRGLASPQVMRQLRFRARLGERFRPLTSTRAYERLMRQHYLRGLRDGLEELEQGQVE